MNTIEEKWNSYVALVMPKDAPPIQMQETRRAFYAGAAGMCEIQDFVSKPNVSENAGMAILGGVYLELKDFSELVASGKA